MMKSDDTDKLIRAKLENYSVTPPAHIWGQVQHQLENRKHRTRVLWYRTVAAAAVLVFVVLAGWYFNATNSEQTIISENSDAVQQTEETTQTIRINQNEIQPENETKVIISEVERKEKAIQLAKATAKTEKSTVAQTVELNEIAAVTQDFQVISKIESRNSRFETDPFPGAELKQKAAKKNDVDLLDVEKLIIDRNLQAMATEKAEKGGWKMGMYLTPGYSSYSANYADEYAQNMTNSGSGGNANVGGGLSVVYKTGKRLMVESGVYYAQNGQKTAKSNNFFALKNEPAFDYAPGDLNYTSNNVQLENGAMAMNSSAGIIAFSATPKGAELSSGFESLNGKTNLMVPGGEFSQVFEFMEVPLLVRYRLVDARLGVEVLTGVTTGFVVGNNAYIDNQYGVQNIGKTEDVSAVNLSGTIGLGTSYVLGKNLSFALEPRFSYYFNSISKNPDVTYKPYRVGIFTGLTYEF